MPSRARDLRMRRRETVTLRTAELHSGRSAAFRVIPEKTALVVVDMQNDYCHPEGTYPRHGLRCAALETVVPAVVKAVNRCKELGLPVIYLRMVWRTDSRGYPVDAGLIVDESRPFLRKEGLRAGTWGAKVLEELSPPDYEVEKPRYSGFYNTHLEGLLRGLGVETLLLAGVVTNVCVEATARDAFHRDFRIVILRDCVGAFVPELHEASLKTLSIFGRVIDSDEVLAGRPSRVGAR